MKRINILAAVLAAAMLASCGGSDSKADSSAASKAETVSSAAAAESTAESTAESVAESTAESTAESVAESTAESVAESTAESTPEAPQYRNIKVMTLGDSITDGFWLEGGYRVFLCNKLEENGLSQYVDFVGSNHSGQCYDNDHEGYTAFAIEGFTRVKGVGSRSGIAKFAPDHIEQHKPDVLTLMIGTNDILSQYDLDNAGNRLESLVDNCLEALPEGGRLYLASLPDMDANDNTYIDKKKFTPETMDEMVAAFNGKVKALAEKKQGEGKNVEFCDVHSVLTKADLYDGVHPNEEGYKKLADYWYDIIVKEITAK
ncbi:Lysophospholipase L1 [Ruminococcaceae bacterium FB2012]|nr:Lysophospholipase L1 [Ruminococcaceae bacterium FB2012]